MRLAGSPARPNGHRAGAEPGGGGGGESGGRGGGGGGLVRAGRRRAGGAPARPAEGLRPERREAQRSVALGMTWQTRHRPLARLRL
jgi:hypothetical protein